MFPKIKKKGHTNEGGSGEPKKSKSTFHRIGLLNTEVGAANADLIDRLVLVTKAAQVVYQRLKMGYNWETGICTYVRNQEELIRTGSAYKTFSRHYRELREQGLVLRLPKPALRDLHLDEREVYYLMNPDIIIPSDAVRQRNRKIWNRYY